MATILVGSVSAVSMSAAEITIEISGATTTGTVSTYVHEETGVKFESDAMTINNVLVENGIDMDKPYGFYEKRYVVDVLDDNGELVDYYNVPINVYLPCEKENCSVLFEGYESSGPAKVEAEYVDGSYKLRMEPGWGTYYICDAPAVNGFSSFEQQTLTDETTGVSVSGMLETGSSLVAYNVRDMYDAFTEADLGFTEEPFASLGEFDGYGVFLAKNMKDAYVQDEMTVTLPYATEGYEVRCINTCASLSDEDTYEADILGMNLVNMTESNEVLAQKYTAFMDKAYPALDAEYVNGSYVVKCNMSGYYFIAPAGSFTITADKIHKVRSKFHYYSEDMFAENDSDLVQDEEVYEETEETEKPTKVEPATTKKTTTTSKEDEKTGNNNIIVPVAIAVVAVVVVGAVIVIICKKKSAKNK